MNTYAPPFPPTADERATDAADAAAEQSLRADRLSALARRNALRKRAALTGGCIHHPDTPATHTAHRADTPPHGERICTPCAAVQSTYRSTTVTPLPPAETPPAGTPPGVSTC